MNAPPDHRALLRDPAAERALTQDGYAVLPWLGSDAAAAVLLQLQALVPCFPDGFYASVHTPDAALRLAVNEVLMSVFRPLVAAHCLQGRVLGGAFINKAPGPRGVLPPHQDWNIVDEAHHRSMNVWLPLVDTSAANGAIQVLPGSHHWRSTVRGPGIPCVYRQVHDSLRRAMRLLPIRAGEVLVYDHRLLHCSDINHSDQPRPGAVMGLVPDEAELKHHSLVEGQVWRFASKVDFLLGGQTHGLPQGLPAEQVLAVDTTPLSDAQLMPVLRPRLTSMV